MPLACVQARHFSTVLPRRQEQVGFDSVLLGVKIVVTAAERVRVS